MKKSIIIFATLMPSIIFAQQKPSLDTYDVKRGEKIGNCSGSKGNICEFEKAVKPSNLSITMISADEMRMTVAVAGLTESERSAWIGKPWNTLEKDEKLYFRQEYPVMLNDELIKELRIAPQYKSIPPGEYEMSIHLGDIVIIFKLGNE